MPLVQFATALDKRKFVKRKENLNEEVNVIKNTIIETHAFLYKITNKINGLVYIGKSCKSFKNVIGRHYRNSMILGKRTKLYDSIRQYGFEHYNFEIIYDVVPKEYIDRMEKWTIANYDSLHEGYNTASGGTGGNVHAGKNLNKK